VLCSLGAGPQRRLLALARPTFRAYADRHGYALDLRTEVLDGSRPAPWSKVVLLRRLLADHDEALWIDADALVVDPSRDLADEVPPDRFLALVQHRYGEALKPNTGVMLIRAGETADAFLDELWNATDLVEHRWWENAAVLRLLGYGLDPPRLEHPTPFFERTHFLGTEWNSIHDDPADAPRIRHYPGWSLKTRFALMALERGRMAVHRRTVR